MATAVAVQREQRFFLQGVSWQTYQSLRQSPENYHVRMTYDRGDLEMMSPSQRHEQFSYLIGRLIDVWTEELDIPVQSCRTMTFQREDLEKGLEPDNCYYVQHEPLVRNKTDLDLTIDPPPDLAIEVDLSRSAVEKMPLYAAFGVPEVWRYDGQTLQVYGLSTEGQYLRRDASIGFPQLPIAELEHVLRQVGSTGETPLVRSFRQWVRANVPSGGKG